MGIISFLKGVFNFVLAQCLLNLVGIYINNEGISNSKVSNTVHVNHHPETKVIDHVQNTLDSEFLPNYYQNRTKLFYNLFNSY